MSQYVHGYSKREVQRLKEQSEILERLLHDGIHFPAGAHVLEAGCAGFLLLKRDKLLSGGSPIGNEVPLIRGI